MAAEFEVVSRDLANLSRALKDVGGGEMRKLLLRRVRAAGKAAIPDVRQAALSELPKSGGLAALVASRSYGVRSSYAGAGASVRIVGNGMKGLRSIDSGTVRHPVFGNRSTWVAQPVRPGFFSGTLASRAPAMRNEIEQVVADVRREIDRRV